MALIRAWLTFDAGAATTGEPAGERHPDPHNRSVRLNPDSLVRLTDMQSASTPVYVATRDFEFLSRHNGGAYGGVIDPDPSRETLQISMLVLVAPDGTLRFVGNCATRLYTDTFAGYVADVHPGKTAEGVLIDHAKSGDFSAYNDWLVGPPEMSWLERDPKSRNLDIEETPEDILAQLHKVAFAYEGLNGWSGIDATVCPWTPMGWNHCVWLGIEIDGTRLTTSGYLADGEPIELWLKDMDYGSFEPVLLAVASWEEIRGAPTIVFRLTGTPATVGEVLDMLDDAGSEAIQILAED